SLHQAAHAAPLTEVQPGSRTRISRTRPTPANNCRARGLPLLPGLPALRELTRWRTWVPAALAAPLSATHWVADRVLRHPALVRLLAHPPLPPGLPEADVHVVRIRHRANARSTDNGDPANLAAGQRDLGPVAFAVRQGRTAPGTAADLAAAAGLHFDVVNRHAEGDPRQRQAVADAGLAARPGRNRVSGLKTVWGRDVRLLAVRVLDQGDAGRPIRIVFDRQHVCGDAVLAVPLEINQAVHLLVPAAAEPDGDQPLVVAAALLLARDEERLFRPVLARVRAVGEVADSRSAGARGCRFVESDAHSSGQWLVVSQQGQQPVFRVKSDH